jgi:Zn-dependent protease with chaperone function
MKKTSSLVISSTIFVLSALPALAATVEERFGLNYASAAGLGTRDLREGIMAIIQAMLGFLGVLAIVIILYGGFVWMTAGGNEENVGKAKKIITAGVIGLAIIFISYAIASFVINSLITATGVPQA